MRVFFKYKEKIVHSTLMWQHAITHILVKSSHIYLYSAFHITDCIKAASQ